MLEEKDEIIVNAAPDTVNMAGTPLQEKVHMYCSQSVSSWVVHSFVSLVLYQNRTVQSCSCTCASCSCKTLCFTLSRLLGITLCMPSLITQTRDPFMLHPVSIMQCSMRLCKVEESKILPQPIPEGVVQHSSPNKRYIEHTLSVHQLR